MQAVMLFVMLVGSASVTLASADTKNRPVSKVITLLKDMVNQLQKESEEDEDVYEVMGCWCETNDKEKTKSITDAQQRIQDLTAGIEESTGKSAQLNTEVGHLAKEVAKNNEALDQATSLRKKQLAEFNEEEKGMLQSISALKSAVVVMSKQHAAEAMLQDSAMAISISSMLEKQLKLHRSILGEVISPAQRRAVQSFAKSPENFLQTDAPSGEIFGILKQMKDTFETNLASSQKEETTNQEAYEDLKAAKKEEISAGQSQLDTKTGELASTDEKKAQNKQDLEDTRKTLEADTIFLADLKERCATVDQEYEMRTKARQMEIQATGKALEYLNSDDARDLFSRSVGFLQVALSRHGTLQQERLSASLREIAQRTADPRLVALAIRARVDAFAKIKQQIQEMVENLTKEKEDEIKHKDFCIDELNENERDTEMKTRDKNDMQAKIEDLTMTIDELTKASEQLKAEIAEMQVQMKRAGEDREKENKDFQLTIADQRATQKLLGAALGVLKGVYDKESLVQQAKEAKVAEPAGPPPPPSFKPMEKNSSGGGVMGMIQNVINDAKAVEAEAIRGEEDSQKGYESFVKNTNDSVEEKSKDLVNKSEGKAKAEKDLVEAKKGLDGIQGELEELYSATADLHKSCDFVLKNFDMRQSARDEEIEALKQTIAIFSGAAFSALLQGHPSQP